MKYTCIRNHDMSKFNSFFHVGYRWQKYLDLIEEANKAYIECSTDDCYKFQRRSDFKEWVESGGITEESFLEAKKRNIGVHYQVIDGKLYRQDHCVFESRYVLKILFVLSSF